MAMERLRRLIWSEKGKYLIFGVLTTLVNYLVFWIMEKLMGSDGVLWINVIAFMVAVVFAFFTNKRFVFASTSWRWRVLLREGASFLGGRIFSFGVEEAGLALYQYGLRAAFPELDNFRILFVDGAMMAKLILSVITVILNYFFSKWFVFRKKDTGETGE